MRYPFKKIEEKWQRAWEKEKNFCVRYEPSRKKYYLLEMFPYPCIPWGLMPLVNLRRTQP